MRRSGIPKNPKNYWDQSREGFLIKAFEELKGQYSARTLDQILAQKINREFGSEFSSLQIAGRRFKMGLKIKTRRSAQRLSSTFYASADRAPRDEVPKSLVTDHNYIVSVKKLKVGMNVFIAGMGVCTYHGSDLLDGGFASGEECLSFSLYTDRSKRRMILPDRLEHAGVRSLLPKKIMLETINAVLKSPRRAATVPERFKRDLDERIKSSDFSEIVSIVRDTRACSAFAEYWGIAAKALDMMADEYSLVMQVGKEAALQEITRLTLSSCQKPAKELSFG